MRLSEFLRLAIPSVGLASLFVMIIAGGYAIYYRIQKHKGNEIHCSFQKLFLTGLLIGYLIVVILATLASRSSFLYESKTSFELFSSYRLALINFNMREWRNILLNIAMGIPLGILLPCVFEKMKHWWLTYATGLLFTITIEVTQLITHRGIFEIDDIFNNAIGCIIGFGFYTLGYALYQKLRKKQIKITSIFAMQLPLCLTILSFAYIFISYSFQELGNLQQAYYKTVNMSHTKVTSLITLDNQPSLQMVYQIKQYTLDECEEMARNIFKQYRKILDEKQTDIYDDSAYFYCTDNQMIITIYFAGGTVDISFPDEFKPITKDLSEQAVRKRLKQENISIPEQATFTQIQDGQYEFSVNTIIDQQYVQGSLLVGINEDFTLSYLHNQIKTYESYKSFPIISQQQAFQLIQEGKFNQDWMLSLDDEIIIQSIQLVYREDSKGFYQPVYLLGIENDQVIYIPAISSS